MRNCVDYYLKGLVSYEIRDRVKDHTMQQLFQGTIGALNTCYF